MKLNNEVLATANKIVDMVNRYYLLDGIVFVRKVNERYFTPLHVTVDVLDEYGIEINCNLPFPEISILVQKLNDDVDGSLNFFNSDIKISVFRNNELIALYNETYENVYLDGIKRVVSDTVNWLRDDDYNSYADDVEYEFHKEVEL